MTDAGGRIFGGRTTEGGGRFFGRRVAEDIDQPITQ